MIYKDQNNDAPPAPQPNRMRSPLVILLAIIASLTMSRAATAQPDVTRLTLGQALDRADRLAFANRATRSMVAAQRAAPTAALRGILPSIRFDAGWVRTTDPIGAFGTTLRQRSITPQDFDPARLNFPAAAPNYMGAMVLEQPLFNADAWIGRRAATKAADASLATADWTVLGTRVEVVRAYYGAILAREKVATLDAALHAANEHVRQAGQAAKNGLVTASDALLASVKAGEVETQFIEADGDLATAKLGLATALGAPRDTLFTLPAELPAADAIRPLAHAALDATAVGERGDVLAARANLAAADADALRARSLYLPRVNGFARYDWNSAAHPYAGDKNWTVGVMASWSPFAGASEIADARATAARRAAAAAMQDGTEAKAGMELEQSANALRTALARLDIAERSVRQSTDAHRIVSRRYDGGLAPVVELLDAAAIETQQRLALAGARYALIVATAERRRALAIDPGAVRALDAAPAAATPAREP